MTENSQKPDDTVNQSAQNGAGMRDGVARVTAKIPHSPAPWRAEKYLGHADSWFVRCADDKPVCGNGSGPVNEANARLIAAAPDLLEALIKVVGCFDIKDGLSVRDEMAIKHATAIISKATQP